MAEFMSGLSMLPSVENVLTILIGTFLGIVVGAIPGLTPAVGMVLCIPLTFSMSTVPAILLLLTVYCAGTYGGSITAILIRTPGTPAAACTVLDGYPLAQQGRGKEALDMALLASTIGGIFSCVVLMVFAPQISKLTINFSSIEYFMIAVFGLSVIVSVSGDSLIKGFLSAALGLFISTIGVDSQSATLRYTFGVPRLQSGIPIVIVLVGLFGVCELYAKAFETTEAGQSEKNRMEVGKGQKGIAVWEMAKYWKTLLVSSLVGTGVGALPGTGAALSSFISYDLAKKRSSHPDTYGKGELDGVCASETANNAVTGATLIPLLTLGIPGDSNVAILLGALTIHGLVPGPQLFQTQGPTVYAMMIGLIMINITMLLEGKLLVRLFARVSLIPYPILGGLVAFFCVVGAYATNNSYFNIYMALLFGVVGFLFRCWKFPVIPLMLGLVLGNMLEQNFRRAIIMCKGQYLMFFTRPISLAFFLLTIGSIGLVLYRRSRSSRI